MSDDLDQRIKIAEHIAEYAGRLIIESFKHSITTKEKSRHDYVTEIDTEIEDLARKEILSIFSEDSILGEEEGLVDGDSRFLWVIDPLDGTNNYVHGIPQAGVQIAVYHGSSIEFAVIHNPFTATFYRTRPGKGAMESNLHHEYQRRLAVSEKPLSDSLVIFDAGIASRENPTNRIFDQLVGQIGFMRVYGVAVLDFPFVASGAADLLISSIPKPVDIAAGCLLVQEAGGVISDFAGRPWDLNSKSIVAGSKLAVSAAVKVIEETVA